MTTKTSRGARNNNPGNIKKTTPRTPWQGLGPSQDTTFVTFESMKWGVRAMARILIRYQDEHNLRSIREIVNRYAPPTDNNPTGVYVTWVSDKAMLAPDAVIDVHQYKYLFPIIKAMIHFENGYQPCTDEQITAGLVLAGVEPEMKAITQTGTIKAAQLSVGTSAVIAAVTEFNEQVQPIVPLATKLMDYAPWLIVAVLLVGMGYIVWRRIDDRRKGLR